MELKTLKDLPCWVNECNGIEEKEAVHREELKAEAVKWVKSIKPKDLDEVTRLEFISCLAIDWIKHFFNLTEENLKDV